MCRASNGYNSVKNGTPPEQIRPWFGLAARVIGTMKT